jgi:hypothetical protein
VCVCVYVCVSITKKLSKSCTNHIQIIRIQLLSPAPTFTNSSFMLAGSPSLSLARIRALSFPFSWKTMSEIRTTGTYCQPILFIQLDEQISSSFCNDLPPSPA